MFNRSLLAACASLLVTAAVMADSNYEQVVQSLDPIHWWRFNDPLTSPSATNSVGSLDGTWHNGPNPVPGLIDPGNNTAAKFWNSAGPTWVVFDHDHSLLLEEGTISFYMYDTTKILEAVIFSKDSNGFSDGGHLTIGTLPGSNVTNGSLYARLQSTTASHLVTTGPINIDVLYHVTFTFGKDGMKLYIDGNLVDENPYTGGMLANLEPWVVGASTAYSGHLSVDPLRHYWSGILDELLIFNYALDATNVADLYHQRLSHIPEPASFALLALGGAGLIIRRRRHI